MKRYQALLMHWFREEPALEYERHTGKEAEQALQALMTATVDIGPQHPQWGRKLWRTYQDGWSPTLLALQAHLQLGECGQYGPSYYRLLREPPSLEFLTQKRHKVMH